MARFCTLASIFPPHHLSPREALLLVEICTVFDSLALCILVSPCAYQYLARLGFQNFIARVAELVELRSLTKRRTDSETQQGYQSCSNLIPSIHLN